MHLGEEKKNCQNWDKREKTVNLTINQPISLHPEDDRKKNFK